MEQLHGFDRSLIKIIQKIPPEMNGFMTVITQLGSPLFSILLILVIIGRTWVQPSHQWLRAEIALALSLPLASLLKLITQRARPETIFVEHMRFKTYSFPSGHAYHSLLLFGFLAYLALRYLQAPWGWIAAGGLILLIILIGISRVYLGAHFPSDVIGGWLLGMLVLFLIIKFLAPTHG